MQQSPIGEIIIRRMLGVTFHLKSVASSMSSSAALPANKARTLPVYSSITFRLTSDVEFRPRDILIIVTDVVLSNVFGVN